MWLAATKVEEVLAGRAAGSGRADGLISLCPAWLVVGSPTSLLGPESEAGGGGSLGSIQQIMDILWSVTSLRCGHCGRTRGINLCGGDASHNHFAHNGHVQKPEIILRERFPDTPSFFLCKRGFSRVHLFVMVPNPRMDCVLAAYNMEGGGVRDPKLLLCSADTYKPLQVTDN